MKHRGVKFPYFDVPSQRHDTESQIRINLGATGSYDNYNKLF